MPETEERSFGLDDAALAVQPTVYAAGAFAGKRVLITGGAGGIGRAAAWLFARLGASVALAGRKADRLEAAAQALRAAGLSASAHAADIREPEAVAALFDAAGTPDILINSAGGQFPGPALDYSPRGWDAVIGTNLTGTWRVTQEVARRWRDAGRGGAVVNIVVVTEHGLHGVAHTIAARSGVVGLTRALAVEWAPLGIRLNCIAPGAIETPGWKVYDPRAVEGYARSNPMMRVGQAWEVAEACAYLGGPAAAYVTGEVLHVAGGAQLWGETWTIEKPDWFRT